ncbi:MAG TPA: hypothetical protein VF786_02775 [Terriglobales bacterium]
MKNIETVTSKKCWRARVTAEITTAHLVELAREAGEQISTADAEAFLNENGHAYEMWMHMMRAGEEFIKSHLGEGRMPVQSVGSAQPVHMVN